MRHVPGCVSAAVCLMMVAAPGVPGDAAAADQPQERKQVLQGPTTQTFGVYNLVLDAEAAAEVAYQPESNRLSVRTLSKDARIVLSARFLVLVENLHGTMEVRLPNGRLIHVEPGKSEIVGRALADDPGQIVVRLASSGLLTALDTPATSFIGQPIERVSGFHVDNPVLSPRPEFLPVSPAGRRSFQRPR